MPEWIHNRAEHLLAKNPSMPKSMAFAIATQQAHATGHSPKGYGTEEGRSAAKGKFDTPKGDEQKANPGNLRTPKLKHAGIGVGSGFTTSQYSGPLSYGPFKMTSQIPGFAAPAMTKVDETLESKAAGGEKVAVDKKTLVHGAKHLGGGYAGAAAALSGQQLLGGLFSKGNSYFSRKIDPQGTLLSKLRAASPVPIEEMQDLDNAMFATLNDGSHKILHGPGYNSAPAIAHELGHHAVETTAAKVLQGMPAVALNDAAPAIGVVSGLLSGMLSEKGSKGRKMGVLAPAVAAAPLLAAEAAASVLGLRRLSQAGASGTQLMQAAVTSLLPGFATYALNAGAGMALAIAAQGGTDVVRGAVTPKKASAALGAMSPQGKLTAAQRMGTPKLTGFAGPSIADVSKPKGFGIALPGAKKGLV